jgi:hypothetical protein
MIQTLSFLLALIFISPSFASQFDGSLTLMNQSKTIKISNSKKKYILAFANKEIASQINKLNSGDYISFDGSANETTHTITVEYINYVGLKDLLGYWIGNDDFCYSFESFSGFKIYKRNTQNRCRFEKNELVRDLSYTINPTSSNWSILVSDNQESFLIDLVLVSKLSAELSLYDPKTGYIIKEIKLKR